MKRIEKYMFMWSNKNYNFGDWHYTELRNNCFRKNENYDLFYLSLKSLI